MRHCPPLRQTTPFVRVLQVRVRHGPGGAKRTLAKNNPWFFRRGAPPALQRLVYRIGTWLAQRRRRPSLPWSHLALGALVGAIGFGLLFFAVVKYFLPPTPAPSKGVGS